MSSIALDVVEEIITALYTMNSWIPDYPTIRAYSLVCRDFLPILSDPKTPAISAVYTPCTRQPHSRSHVPHHI
ncbi:hypothetical protein BDN70DRAFT_885185 [Pholiota conissans]|uniref:Uncharacterized protein n=1 Tax=Pholiota conissans TaxID=109636 RepID=A0A9P5YUN4_9AGAR|nr:hypothetical protein BDN70DRAFT_885185 [Pholiota conissans]